MSGLRFLTAGESHGPCLTAVLEGLPAGLKLERAAIDRELARRQQGYGRGGRMKIETDRIEILSGLRFGETLGGPLTLSVVNKDYKNWGGRMAPFGEPEGEKVTAVRPGHADLTGVLKYARTDVRDILERSSARETTMRVAVGAVCKAFLRALGITVVSQVLDIGGERVDESVVGIFEVAVRGVPLGLGSHIQWDRRLDARLAGALMSIQAIKGVEIGAGFKCADRPGSVIHDEVFLDKEGHPYRKTNRAGGLEGGMSNGEEIILRAVMKPIPTLMQPLQSVDIESKQAVLACKERSDTCAVPAAAVVGEAMAAFVVAEAVCEKFGADALTDVQAALTAYKERLAQMW